MFVALFSSFCKIFTSKRLSNTYILQLDTLPPPSVFLILMKTNLRFYGQVEKETWVVLDLPNIGIWEDMSSWLRNYSNKTRNF